MQIQNLLSGEGIEVLASSSPGFAEHLAAMLDSVSLQKVAPILPTSIIVINNTGPLLSLTTIHTYPERIYPAGTPWRYVRSKTAGGPTLMIEPGDEYLFTPVPRISPGLRPPATRLNSPYIDSALNDAINRFAEHDLSAAVIVSIDSIIFADGTLAGPDSAGRLSQVNSKNTAEREVLDTVDTLHGDELKKQLLYYATMDSSDMFTKQRRDYAILLLRVLNEDGDAAAVELISSFRRKKQLEQNTEKIVRKTP